MNFQTTTLTGATKAAFEEGYGRKLEATLADISYAKKQQIEVGKRNS